MPVALRSNALLRNLTDQGKHDRLDCGADLLEPLGDICRKENIRCGHISAIGAVKRARIDFYDQQQRGYRYRTIEQTMEIVGLTGNVSLREKAPMVHAHLCLGDASGHRLGGHLAAGTMVFAWEFMTTMYSDAELERRHDPVTGLWLWVAPKKSIRAVNSVAVKVKRNENMY